MGNRSQNGGDACRKLSGEDYKDSIKDGEHELAVMDFCQTCSLPRNKRQKRSEHL